MHAGWPVGKQVYRNMLGGIECRIFDAAGQTEADRPLLVTLSTGRAETAKHIFDRHRQVRPCAPWDHAQRGMGGIRVRTIFSDLKELPKRLADIGGAYIACEIARIMTAFGRSR